MNNKCQKIRDAITELVIGILPEARKQTVQHHLSECSACRDYAEKLKKQEQLLNGLFANFDSTIKGGQEQLINAIGRIEKSGSNSIFTVGKDILKGSIARSAFTAAAIIVMVMYFVITLTWISQINECILHSM